MLSWQVTDGGNKFICRWLNESVDIKFSVQKTFLEYTSSGMLKAKIFKCQIILNSLGARKPNGLNRVARIAYGRLCLKDEYVSMSNNYMI